MGTRTNGHSKFQFPGSDCKVEEPVQQPAELPPYPGPNPPALHSGSCLCGAVEFLVDSSEKIITCCCHCTDDRRWSGLPFLAAHTVNASGFKYAKGEEKVIEFQKQLESGRGQIRSFCGICGTGFVF